VTSCWSCCYCVLVVVFVAVVGLVVEFVVIVLTVVFVAVVGLVVGLVAVVGLAVGFVAVVCSFHFKNKSYCNCRTAIYFVTNGKM